jgi:hypothetical protein
MSTKAAFTPAWADFVSAAKTLPILCHQHGTSLVSEERQLSPGLESVVDAR